MKKLLKVLVSLSFALTMISTCSLDAFAANGLKIRYLDVGSGDAIYIECDGQNMLIDAGYISPYSKYDYDAVNYPMTPVDQQFEGDINQPVIPKDAPDWLEQLRKLMNENNNSEISTYLKKLGVSHINYIVATHPHRDHIGGMSHVLNTVGYDHFMYNGRYYGSRLFNYMMKLANDNKNNGKGDILIPEKGYSFSLGNAKVTVLSDQQVDYTNISGTATPENNGSLVLKLEYGNRSFLFTGDAEVAAQDLLRQNYGEVIKNIDVLKVPHHGHNNNNFADRNDGIHSGNYPFFQVVNPVVSIVTDGTNNTSSTLPNTKVKKDLSGSDLWDTKDGGTITVDCDGTSIDISREKSTTVIKGFKKGDANRDGKITASDYVLLRRQILGTYGLVGLGNYGADVNKDGKISASDYVLIRRHILGTYKIND